MVFYRKYRSQTVADLDLTEVREKLTSILQSKEIPHAFLFTGPRGLGKTSSARILAKAMNCENRKNSKNKSFEPCNKCQSCISITNGSHIDVLEIDAASNRGIDEIRSLRERVKFSASSASKKVYIIDEVHMLTNEAFNALLKTLEEPPSHVIFILCTTESTKIPQTILSRVFLVNFKEAKYEEMKKSLQRIAKGEGLDIQEDVFHAIYKLSQGSFRDAHKTLEELASVAKNKKITMSLVEDKLHLSSIDLQINNFLEALAKKDVKTALNVITSLKEQGSDFLFVTSQIVGLLREHMLFLSGFGSRIKNSPFELWQLGRLLEMVNNAYMLIKTSVLPYLPLELVVIEWCNTENHSLDSIAHGLKDSDNNIVQKSKPDDEAPKESNNNASKQPNNNLPDNSFLYQLIDAVKLQNQTAAALLRSCKLKEQTEKTLILETAYEFHQKKLMENPIQNIIEENLFKIMNKKMSLQIVIHTG